MDYGQLAHDIQQVIFDISKILLYPVLVAAIGCLVWVLIELGVFLYEVYLRVRYRDLEALEIRTLRAREAFVAGQPRKAYRYLQENNYSTVVVRFLFDLIRNYQTKRLAEKPLKLLQEYEFYTIKRLEKTRILVRIGPMLGLMGTLIPLAPALEGLAKGDTQQLSDNLRIAFSVTVIGLLIGGLGFLISVFRDRFYSQDISDLEYLLELLEGSGGRLKAGRTQRRKVRPEEIADEEASAEPGRGAPTGEPAYQAGGTAENAGTGEPYELPVTQAPPRRVAELPPEADVVGGRDAADPSGPDEATREFDFGFGGDAAPVGDAEMPVADAEREP